MATSRTSFVMEERFAPSRPLRLGTRRRKPRAVSVLPEAGASRREAAPSLDTEKHLATSVSKSGRVTAAEWLEGQITEREMWQRQWALHRQLTATVRRIWQSWRSKGTDDESRAWYASYAAEQQRKEGEEPGEAYKRVKDWLKANKPTGSCAESLKWEKTWAALNNCQMEWIGYSATCCGDKTRPVAVPIGCNHRLCPMCAWQRSQRARVRIKSMFDRLNHPAMITFTVPNKTALQKKDFEWFRKLIRKFIAQHPAIQGGIYSIEVTFNRDEGTWHVHAHVLADMAGPLPTKRDAKIDFHGERTLPFTALKWQWEFDWLCLTSTKWGKMPALKPPAKSAKSIRKWLASWEHYRAQFATWVHAKREHSNKWAKEWTGTHWIENTANLTPEEMWRFHGNRKWNAANTRAIDLRPVLDREGAAREVLKYITKGAAFSDSPEAVETFCNAVKGARLVQTFGTWYGFDIDTKFDTEHFDDWGKRECACGLNCWERLGVFHAHDVQMSDEGRWYLKRTHNHNSRGTVTRPTIRALEPAPRVAPEDSPTEVR